LHFLKRSVFHSSLRKIIHVSESSVVRMLDDGKLFSEITPELWILGGYVSRLSGPTRS
jgi:hypothetical protein